MEKLSPEALLEIERQLSAPDGENGIKIAEEMHRSNIGMTRAAYQALNIQNDMYILEIGHGNCAHLKEIFDSASSLIYHGLEISETMHLQAKQINAEFQQKNQAIFSLYDGLTIKLPDDSFHVAFSVNSIYFWKKPIVLLNDIYRVLKPGGHLAIVFALKDFMKQLPFVNDRFSLFDHQDITQLIKQTPFEIATLTNHQERIQSKHDEWVDREFCVALLKK